MCGLIGVLGYCECYWHLIEGLTQLQNRGYDSAGIFTFGEDSKQIHKVASRENSDCMKVLQNNTSSNPSHFIGIGHTRWATHGPKTDINAHPHLDTTKRFALVHNGIIENYLELKARIMERSKKFRFISQTDTEVVVNLIAFEYQNRGDVEDAILAAVSQLQGTYALAIVDLEDPNSLYCIRNGSPLLVGVTEQFAIVTSEKSGFNGQMVNYHVLDNNDLCILTKEYGSITFTTQSQSYETLDVNQEDAGYTTSLGFYPFYTVKEIEEQPDSISRALGNGGRLLSEDEVRLGGLDRFREQLTPIKHLILLGCGTSYHAGMVALSYFKDLCHFQTVQLFDGAEFTERDFPRSDETTGLIFLSQSGETRDLHRCIQLSRRDHVVMIGVVNVVDSLIAREVDCGVYLNAGKEVAVASTKSFTSQCVVLMLIAIWFSQWHCDNSMKRSRYIRNLHNLSEDVRATVELSKTIIPKLLPLFSNYRSTFILGKGAGEAIAREGALKIKEIAYIHAEGYSASALKHGPFALLEPGFPVIIIAIDDHYYDKCLNALEEIKARGANVVLITNSTAPIAKADRIIRLPPNTHHTAEILSVVPLQYLAYSISIGKGINPDFPKNLAKVVTVE